MLERIRKDKRVAQIAAGIIIVSVLVATIIPPGAIHLFLFLTIILCYFPIYLQGESLAQRLLVLGSIIIVLLFLLWVATSSSRIDLGWFVLAMVGVIPLLLTGALVSALEKLYDVLLLTAMRNTGKPHDRLAEVNGKDNPATPKKGRNINTFEELPSIEEMRRYCPGYSPQTMREILEKLQDAYQNYQREGREWGPYKVAKLISMNTDTAGRYFRALRKNGIYSWNGIPIPGRGWAKSELESESESELESES